MGEIPLLEVQDLTTGYGDVAVTDGLSFEIAAGEMTALMGANGAGKTATMLAIMGINPATRGAIRLAGEDITRQPAPARVRQGLSLVLEGRRLFPALSVRENLELARSAVGRRGNERFDAVMELFPPLLKLLDRPSGALSGGEQQMCALGRGLMGEPRLLLVDELSLGLAPRIVDTLLDAVTRIHRDLDTTMLFVEQDTERALSVAERAIVLSRGHKVLDGPAADVVARRAELEDAFMGLVDA